MGLLSSPNAGRGGESFFGFLLPFLLAAPLTLELHLLRKHVPPFSHWRSSLVRNYRTHYYRREAAQKVPGSVLEAFS